MTDVFETMAGAGAHRLMLLNDPVSGLRAIIAIDDLTLGPAYGGIRMLPYASVQDAIADVRKLSSAMTLKCAIAGLDAGGGKTVVIDHPGMDRAAAFRRLGAYIEDLGGLYYCAGDLGITNEDLRHVAERTRFCNLGGEALGEATGTTILNGIRACAAERGIDSLAGLRVAVQGCGLIGAGVARALAVEGVQLLVSDIDADRARVLADEIGGGVVPADGVLLQEVDILSPCAIGGVLTPAAAAAISAWAICGGANNQLTAPAVADQLAERGIGYVPDFLASSGAVIVGASVVDNRDPAPALAAVETTTRTLLRESASSGRSTVAIAEAMARSRIAAARTAAA